MGIQAGGGSAGSSQAMGGSSGVSGGAGTGADVTSDSLLPEIIEVACSNSGDQPSLGCPNSTLCGNGTIDSCELESGGPNPANSPPPQFIPEVCDGPLPSSTTCASIGFADGQLKCGSWCGFDVTDCTGCSKDPHVVACDDRFSNLRHHRLLDLKAYASMTALLIGGGDQFRLSLVPLGTSSATEEHCFSSTRFVPRVLARTATGWVLADEEVSSVGGTPDLVTIMSLDADGHKRGARLLSGYGRITLIERGDGGPLLVGVRDGSSDLATGLWAVDAMLLDDDSNVIWKAHVFDTKYPTTSFSGVYTGASFLLLAPSQIVKVGLTGTVATSPLTMGILEPPKLAWSGTEGRLAWVEYTDALQRVHLARLDASGAAIGTPVVIANGDYDVNIDLVAGGFGTFVLLPRRNVVRTSEPALSGVFVDDALGVTAVPFPLALDPRGVFIHRVAAVGADVFAAWSVALPLGVYASGIYASDPGEFGFARIGP